MRELRKGDPIRYLNYGVERSGLYVGALGDSAVEVTRADGPLSGRNTWILRESIIETMESV